MHILQELFAFKNHRYRLFKDCERFELTLGDKIWIFIVLYRSPSQSQDQFKSFKESLELNFETAVQYIPFLVVVLCDFNAKSSKWCKNDIIRVEDKAIENISSQFGLYQVINEPKHMLEHFSSDIDLLFTLQRNLITESGVHSSLYLNSHHQIISVKLNLKILYLPPYFYNAWHYHDANTNLIRPVIDIFDWIRAFFNTIVNKKVFVLKETILHILSKLILNEILTVDDKHLPFPPWFMKKNKKSYPRRKQCVYNLSK